MEYNFQGTFNIDQLTTEIRNSSILTALDYLSYNSPNLVIYFKANLSSEDEVILNSLLQSHTPLEPQSEVQVVDLNIPKDSAGLPIFRQTPFSDTGGFRFRGTSFKNTVLANTTKNIDFQITQERWVNGGQLILSSIGEDDKGTFQVVDKDYLYAGILYPADFNGIAWSVAQPTGVILDEFIKDYYIPNDQKLEIVLAYPARILAGLYLRLVYTSTSNTDCVVKCNLYLHWKAS